MLKEKSESLIIDDKKADCLPYGSICNRRDFTYTSRCCERGILITGYQL